MADSQLGWSDAQWEKVNNAVTEAFTKASVAGAFLPCYGPLPGSAENVKKEKLKINDKGVVTVADDTTLKLFNLRVHVELSSEQVADDSLSSALLAFRRAANTLAQTEDEIVFNGYGPANTKEIPADLDAVVTKAAAQMKQAADAAQAVFDALTKAQKKTAQYQKPLRDARELAAKAAARKHTTDKTRPFVASNHPLRSMGLAEPDVTPRPIARSKSKEESSVGSRIVTAVVQAIGELEDIHHPGPFAVVLGRRVFEEAHRPSPGSMVLPADRITPMLDGPLLRSGSMTPDRGVVVSLSAGAIDIVVATPPSVQFLQRKEDAKYFFRVYERFALRIKDKDLKELAVRPFQISGL